MRFLQVVDSVKNQLSAFPLQEKAQIFKEVLNCPITITDGVFYVSSKLYSENRMKDYLSIREHWMNMHEFDRLFNYFENLDQKDK